MTSQIISLAFVLLYLESDSPSREGKKLQKYEYIEKKTAFLMK